MERLSKDDPRVLEIVQQMYGQRQQVGKIPSVVGYLNMQHLHGELCKMGWLAQLEEDQETIRLEPVEGREG